MAAYGKFYDQMKLNPGHRLFRWAVTGMTASMALL